jgi:rubrerythrin
MMEFGTVLSIKRLDKKQTHEELVKGIRLLVAAEYEAVHMYEQILGATDNAYAKAVIHGIINEEKVQAGQFLELLMELQPGEEAFYAKSAKEISVFIS